MLSVPAGTELGRLDQLRPRWARRLAVYLAALSQQLSEGSWQEGLTGRSALLGSDYEVEQEPVVKKKQD